MRFVLMIMATAWVTALAGISAALAQTVAEREAAFKQAVLEYRDSTLSDPSKWLAPESPWAPFIGKQFSDGLSDAQKEEYLKAQDAMNCDRVLTFEVLGLYALHPETGPAFEHAQVREAFEQHIAPKVSFGLRRCHALTAINDAVEAAKRSYPFTEDKIEIFLRLYPSEVSSFDTLLSEPLLTPYIGARADLLRLAVCYDYPPAFHDHITLSLTYDLPLAYGQDSVIFAARARLHGVDEQKIAQFEKDTSPPDNLRPLVNRRILEMRARLAEGKISAARRLTLLHGLICEENH